MIFSGSNHFGIRSEAAALSSFLGFSDLPSVSNLQCGYAPKLIQKFSAYPVKDAFVHLKGCVVAGQSSVAECRTG